MLTRHIYHCKDGCIVFVLFVHVSSRVPLVLEVLKRRSFLHHTHTHALSRVVFSFSRFSSSPNLAVDLGGAGGLRNLFLLCANHVYVRIGARAWMVLSL